MDKKPRAGFAMTGSFCTFSKILPVMEQLVKDGWEVTPILSANAAGTDTRFGTAESFRTRIEKICGRQILTDLPAVEPIGPQKWLDVLIVAPCTGNTLAKLAGGITDTSVTLAVKAHLRNERPVVLAVSTNDALSGNGKNIGELLNRKHYYFVPMGQDDAEKKPRSMVADMEKIPQTAELAFQGKQLQPMLL